MSKNLKRVTKNFDYENKEILKNEKISVRTEESPRIKNF